jgi:hypothetical protein
VRVTSQHAVKVVPSNLPENNHDHRFQPHMFNTLVDEVHWLNPTVFTVSPCRTLQASGEVTGFTKGDINKLPAWTKRHLAFKEAKQKEEDAQRQIEERRAELAADKKAAFPLAFASTWRL